MSTPLEVTVNVRSLAVGGAGVGEVIDQSDGAENLLGITAFVPFTAVGETVSARVTERKERYLKGQLLEVQNSAANRVEPPCEYFQVCGGCELQHVSYEGQLSAKQEMIAGALRAGKLSTAMLDRLRRIVPGPDYGYRRRVSLHIDSSGRVGFYRENSRSVVPISSCSVAVPEINHALEHIQDLGRALQGKVSSLLLEADAKGLVAVIKSPYDLTPTERKGILDTAKEHFDNITLMVGGTEVGGIGRQILELPLNDSGSITLRVPAASFSQVNWDVNLKLLGRVGDAIKHLNGAEAYDLYAGAGNFSLPLARAGLKVTAVESDKRLVSFGRENAKRYNLEHKLTYVDSSVEKFLGSKSSKDRIPLVIADPPRSGLGKLVPSLQFAQELALISCHLPSFVRDLKALLEQGWELESIEPFDMFAQTSYVEILGLLRRA